MTIAIDVMGGDHSPQVIIEAVRMLPREERDVILVGRREAIEHCANENLGVRIVDAPDVVDMHDSPSHAIKHKRRSSLAVAAELVRDGEAAAMISAGNTGAAMAFGIFVLGRLARVSRPAIAAILPSRAGRCLLLDAGANVDCKPDHLCDFALLGSAYSIVALGCERPRVGLLSIGAERSKGNTLIFATHALMEALPGIHYVGNVEGVDITQGHVDVIVCDGFVGNSVLKFGEAVAEMIYEALTTELERVGTPDAAVRDILRRTAAHTDYTEYGGAPLLGLNGGCIICHGRSSAKAIRNAILLAKQTDFARLNTRISDTLAQAHAAA